MAPKSWLAEWIELTGHVEQLFADAKARGLQVPPRDACASVASVLLVVRDRAVAAPLRKDNTRGARNGARKSAKAFLRHIRPLQQKLAAQIAEIREIEMLGDLAPMLASILRHTSNWRRRRVPSKPSCRYWRRRRSRLGRITTQ
jgi:hypothetical protein